MNEYEQLIARKFQPYSEMHQAMYKTIAELLRNKPANILEVGCGIGWGARTLLDANAINSYTGVEKDTDCCAYLSGYLAKFYNVQIFNEDFNTMDLTELPRTVYDFVLCIEVIEHLTKEEAITMLRKLNSFSRIVMFMSTPKKETDEHGAFTEKEIEAMLRLTHWNFIGIEWQLPHTLYICQKSTF